MERSLRHWAAGVSTTVLTLCKGHAKNAALSFTPKITCSLKKPQPYGYSPAFCSSQKKTLSSIVSPVVPFH